MVETGEYRKIATATGNLLNRGPSMSNFRLSIGAVLILALPFVLGGCPAAIVGGIAAAGGAGYAANQERGADGSVEDLKIKTNIQNAG